MASSKAPCIICGKVAGLFTCRGCQQDFCTRHVVEHRQELGKQMDELTLEHDRFRQNLNEQTTDSRQHPLLKEIDEWEQESIDKIRHTADHARQQLHTIIVEHTTKLTNSLMSIADELNKAREDDDYFETDLKQWMEKIDTLKKELAQPSNIKLWQEDNNVISFIPKFIAVVSSKEIFERSTQGVQIEDNGQVIVKEQILSHATVRGSGKYSSGQHRFRFRIEEYSSSKWMLVGIVSQDEPFQANSYNNRTFYGWGGRNQVYLNGTNHQGFNGYTTDIEKNDIIELCIDCTASSICLTNERTHSTSKLQVNQRMCPFPWQLNFNLYHSHDRVRILQV